MSSAFQKIYKRWPLKWPQLLQVDPGREFVGVVTKEIEKHSSNIRGGRVDIHRDQAIVENSTASLLRACSGTSMQSK